MPFEDRTEVDTEAQAQLDVLPSLEQWIGLRLVFLFLKKKRKLTLIKKDLLKASATCNNPLYTYDTKINYDYDQFKTILKSRLNKL